MLQRLLQTGRTITACILLLCPALLYSQAVTVFGNNADARNCYQAARLAATMNIASADDIDACSLALNFGRLVQRDIVATFINRGVLHSARQNFKKAYEDYNRARDINPGVAEIYVNRGNIFFHGMAFDRAIKEYTKALTLAIRADHVAHLNRGMAYEQIKDYKHAEEDYRKALELVPEWNLAEEKLSRLLDKLSNS